MNEIAEKDVINIENMIYEIDGKEVMLDSDVVEYLKNKLMDDKKCIIYKNG